MAYPSNTTFDNNGTAVMDATAVSIGATTVIRQRVVIGDSITPNSDRFAGVSPLGGLYIANPSGTALTVVSADPWIVAVPSASHGPRMVQLSTSVSTVLIPSPGVGKSILITSLLVTNAGTVNCEARVGSSANADTVVGYLLSKGGALAINFDPPWKVQDGDAVNARVTPNSGGDVFFNVNYFVA